jgi:transcriptional regulator with XRE-family HTH domain
MAADPCAFIMRLRKRLTDLGLPQARLADAAGVAPQHLTRWLRCGRSTGVRPALLTMVRLDDAMTELEVKHAPRSPWRPVGSTDEALDKVGRAFRERWGA